MLLLGMCVYIYTYKKKKNWGYVCMYVQRDLLKKKKKGGIFVTDGRNEWDNVYVYIYTLQYM